MGTYTDTYVEMLQQDLQHQYRKVFEVSKQLTDELEIARRTIENLDTNSCVLYSENQRLETQFQAVKKLLDAERNNTAQVEKKLVDALGVLSDRDSEIERLTFALKGSDNELESIRNGYENRIDELRTELNDVKELYYNRLKIEEVQDEEIERLTRTNKKRVKVAELRWLLDGHTDVLDEHRTAILQVREAVDQNKETLSAAQREMLATLDRHDGLISKAFACIDNHSDSIYKQQQSIDALLSAIENQPKTKDDLWTYIRRQMNQQGVGGNNEEEEAR